MKYIFEKEGHTYAIYLRGPLAIKTKAYLVDETEKPEISLGQINLQYDPLFEGIYFMYNDEKQYFSELGVRLVDRCSLKDTIKKLEQSVEVPEHVRIYFVTKVFDTAKQAVAEAVFPKNMSLKLFGNLPVLMTAPTIIHMYRKEGDILMPGEKSSSLAFTLYTEV